MKKSGPLFLITKRTKETKGVPNTADRTMALSLSVSVR